MLGSEEHTILLSRKRLNQEMKKNVYHCSCRHLIPPSLTRMLKPSGHTFAFAARHIISSSSTRLTY